MVLLSIHNICFGWEIYKKNNFQLCTLIWGSVNVKLFLFAFWVILHAFLSSADFFSTSTLKKNNSGRPSVSNSLVLDQACYFVGPDLSQNCLQMLSADNTVHVFCLFCSLIPLIWSPWNQSFTSNYMYQNGSWNYS